MSSSPASPSSRPNPPSLTVDGKLDRQAAAAELRRALGTLLPTSRLDLSYDIRLIEPGSAEALENPEILVVFRGRDLDLLLERNAELLKALEHIALRWLRLDPRFYDRIGFDAADYRALRIEELKLSARAAADRVRETRSPFRFNSMSARERRILHLVLKDEKGVQTASEGAGDDRLVVVHPVD